MPAAPSANAPVPSEMAPATVVLVLSLLLGIQPVTTDLYPPAFIMAAGASSWTPVQRHGEPHRL